jgi:rhodanese-related sulfurtransferase
MKKKTTLILTLICLFFAGSVIFYTNSSLGKSGNTEKMAGKSNSIVSPITQPELIKYLNKPDVTIVDLREPVGFQKSHIPNAINIPFEDFQKRYHELDSSKLIVLVCHVGSMGDASGQLLLQKGFKHVVNLSGGMAKWSGPVTN